MRDTQMAARPRLETRWVPVTDARGRTTMHAVWIAVDAVQAASTRRAA